MNTKQILEGLSGAELQGLEVLSDCYAQGARELCLQIKLRCNGLVRNIVCISVCKNKKQRLQLCKTLIFLCTRLKRFRVDILIIE